MEIDSEAQNAEIAPDTKMKTVVRLISKIDICIYELCRPSPNTTLPDIGGLHSFRSEEVRWLICGESLFFE